MKTFSEFDLADPLNEVLTEIGYETPTPVQAEAIPLVLENRDVLATAQTGTGKTAAFALPLISKMLRGWTKQVLIVAPTRELAEQIGEVLKQLTQKTPQLKTAVVIGGLGYHQQIRWLRANPAFVVGTPGRLLDQADLGHLKLKDFGALVIDEADRLLDMGFEPQMNQIVALLPKERHSMLFSATLPDEIVRLANSYLREPVRVSIGAVSKPIDKIRQDVIMTTAQTKDQRLIQEIDKVAGSIIIFTKTKWKTEKLASFLEKAGHNVARIHGDRTQAQRSRAIADFRSGEVRILVATDIAARGIDIPLIQHVINYDLPMAAEDYIHRIGRTARAGAEGHSIAFVTPEETMLWARIYKMIHGHYPDQHPGRMHKKGQQADKRAGNQNKSRAPRQVGSRDFGARREDRNEDRRSKPEQKGPRKAKSNQFSPRREQELLAEKFLKDERRAGKPAAKSKPAAPAPSHKKQSGGGKRKPFGNPNKGKPSWARDNKHAR